MPLELSIPKVEAPKLSASLPSFSTTSNVSVGNSGFSSSGNTVNVSSLSSNGIKTSVAPPLDLKSITPSVNLGGKVNLTAESLKTLTTKAGVTATIGAAAAAMHIPLGLPNTTDALKTLGVPTDLKSLQKALNFELPKIPAFPGLNFALLLGKSPQFIAEVVLKYKTICLPHIPGVKLNMAQALAAISILKAVASGQGGAIVKHLLEGIANEVKAELVQNLQESINAGLKETEKSLKEVIDNAAKSEISLKVKEQKQETDDEGNPIPMPEIKASFDTSAVDGLADKLSSDVNDKAFSDITKNVPEPDAFRSSFSPENPPELVNPITGQTELINPDTGNVINTMANEEPNTQMTEAGAPTVGTSTTTQTTSGTGGIPEEPNTQPTETGTAATGTASGAGTSGISGVGGPGGP